MSTCNLQECFLNADMDRLDHPEYFQFDFQCSELNEFFQQFKEEKRIFRNNNRKLLNLFFDRLICKNRSSKNIYIRLKWLTYLHQIVSSFLDSSSLLVYIQKALSYFGKEVENEETKYGPYERYLNKLILKPYIQYMSKLCMLKQNDTENSNNENYGDQKIKWFQTYNFIVNACEIFHQALKEVRNYFSHCFPFLNRICLNIVADLKERMHYIWSMYSTNRDSKIQVLQIEGLQEKINNLVWENEFSFGKQMPNEMIYTEIEGCSKEQITEFMSSGRNSREDENETTVPSFDMH